MERNNGPGEGGAAGPGDENEHPPRLFEIVHELRRHKVRYVLIGGYAAVALGSPMLTGDVDICYALDDENLERLARALRELGATLRGAPADLPFLLDARTLRAGDTFTFSTRAGSLDCLGTPSGTTGYADLARGASELELDGVPVSVASIEDLMRMKRAAGRPRDLVALEWLGALRDEIEGRP